MILKLSGTDWQEEVINSVLYSKDRFISLMAGRRAGKTFTWRAVMTMACIVNAGFNVWYIAPNYSQAREQFDGLTANTELSVFIKKTRMQPYPVIEFKNGSRIGFRSFDRPKNLRGSGLDLCLCDEIQDFNGNDFWAVVRPLISDRRGKLCISGQHRGTEAWYYKELFMHGIEGKKGYRSWNIPSSRGLVYQSAEGQEELRLAKEQVPKIVWDVEYDCIPCESLTAVFRTDDLEKCKKGKRLDRSIGNNAYVIGLDLGLIADHTSVTVLDVNTHTFVYEKRYPLHTKHAEIAPQIARLSRDFNGALVVYDSTGAGGAASGKKKDPYIKAYRGIIDNMMAVHWNYETKQTLVNDFMLALEQNQVFIPAELTELHKEMSIYEFEYLKGGKYNYSAPKGQHDDVLDSAMMAWHGRKKGQRTTLSGVGSIL